MGREVRMVHQHWQHPKNERGRFQPLHDGSAYKIRASAWMDTANAMGLQHALDEHGAPPDLEEYMPLWTEAERTHFMMYECTSDGTPISPAFATPEGLARWLADTNASAFAGMGATYEQWLDVARGGWAPSAVLSDGRLTSGVAAMSNGTETEGKKGGQR